MSGTHLTVGDRAPNFEFLDADGSRRSLYSEATGGPLVLTILTGAREDAARELDALAATAPAMLEAGAHLFVIGDDPGADTDRLPGDVLRVPDADGRIAALFGTGGEILTLVLDPNQRMTARLERDATPGAERARAAVEAAPRAEGFAAPRHPPVLSIPRVLSPEQCRRLIDYFDSEGGTESGVYSLKGDQAVRRIDHSTKRRHDALIRDPALVEMMTDAMGSRVFPEIFRAFQARMTRVEELKIVHYDSTPGGYFRPHRDNTMPSNAHRRFAITLNLNAEDYEGGRLRFPEYGGASYKPATGEAVVFSCTLMHEAMNVENGVRYVLLSFLYDEEGEQMRQAFRRQIAEQQA